MRRILIVLASNAVLVACGSSSTNLNPAQQPFGECVDYCTRVAATCTGADTQYTGLTGTCGTYCTVTAWPEGTPGDATGNTGACRMTHVGLAAAAAAGSPDRTLHCGHAGPTGGNQCGSWCEDYCFLALKNCTGANAAGLGFTDQASCLTACSHFPTNGSISGTVAPTGNNVQCRIYHAGAAGAVSPVPHCGHAQVISSGTVGSTTPNGPCN